MKETIDTTYDIGPLWENAYARHLNIVDHIHELAIIDDELRRTKNRRNADPADISALEDHFRKELADLVLVALKDLPASLLEERRQKFVDKAKEDR